MKTRCIKCGHKFSSKKFRPGGHVCRICRSAYSRGHYERNKASYLARSKKQNAKARARLQAYIWGLKDGKSCVICNKFYPHYVLDFHHRSGEKKEEDISTMVFQLRSLAHIQSEISKCDIMCANCHRELTWIEQHGPVAQLVRAPDS